MKKKDGPKKRNPLVLFFLFMVDIIGEIWYAIAYWFECNLYNLGVLIEVLTPYIMLFIGQSVVLDRGYMAVGGEVCLPILLLIISTFMRRSANKLNRGYTVPVPPKRFTKDEGYGEYSINENDVDEIILYLAELEDYLQKTGRL